MTLCYENLVYTDMNKGEPPLYDHEQEIVIVSAFLDIKREEWATFSRSTESYLSSFRSYLRYKAHKIIVFLDDKYADQFSSDNLTVIPINNEWMKTHIYAWQQLEKSTEIMQSYFYKSILQHRINLAIPENVYAEYNAINHSKIDFIAFCIYDKLIPPDSLICWSDFGYFYSILGNDQFILSKLVGLDARKFDPDKITFCLRNKIQTRDEDMMFTIMYAPEIFTGSFFAGSSHNMLLLQKIYHVCLQELYDHHLSDDDQHIYLRCFLKNPSLFQLYIDETKWPRALCYFAPNS